MNVVNCNVSQISITYKQSFLLPPIRIALFGAVVEQLASYLVVHF